jgi:hypothetical protein
VPYLVAFLIFIALAAASWAVSVDLYKGTLGDTTPNELSESTATAAVAVGAASLTSFVEFPAGYLVALLVWAVAAFAGLGLSAGRAAVLFAYLAVSSLVARLVVLGVLDLTAN